mgnify:CR=1 FL=1
MMTHQAPRLVAIPLEVPLEPPVTEGTPEHALLERNLRYVLPRIIFMQLHTLGSKGELRFEFEGGQIVYNSKLWQGD